MGLEQSRQLTIPPFINKRRDAIVCSWQNKNVVEILGVGNQDSKLPTISPDKLTIAATYLREYFGERYIRILEVFAGNCTAGQIVTSRLNVDHIYTDIFKYPHKIEPFNQLSSVDAVMLFGPYSDVLLMISPPPVDEEKVSKMDTEAYLGYGDYFACEDFIAQSDLSGQKKYIVFIGELGAADGSPGMYRHMMEHSRLKLVMRKMISSGIDISGGKIEKELFIFSFD